MVLVFPCLCLQCNYDFNQFRWICIVLRTIISIAVCYVVLTTSASAVNAAILAIWIALALLCTHLALKGILETTITYLYPILGLLTLEIICLIIIYFGNFIVGGILTSLATLVSSGSISWKILTFINIARNMHNDSMLSSSSTANLEAGKV